MAEFTFYCIWDDSLDYLCNLVNLGRFIFIVDMWYASNNVYQFTKLTDAVLDVLHKRPRLYLWSDEYSQYPPYLANPSPNKATMIDPIFSGPALDLTLPHGVENDGVIRLGYGILMYQPYYVIPGTYESYKPPENLKQAYRDVQKILRKGMIKRFMQNKVQTIRGDLETKDRIFWIGLNAIKLVDENKAGIQLHGYVKNFITGIDLLKTKSK